eukprot:7147861-Prymnesium_polylepis.1
MSARPPTVPDQRRTARPAVRQQLSPPPQIFHVQQLAADVRQAAASVRCQSCHRRDPTAAAS